MGGDGYYGAVQLLGNNFYALLHFHKAGPLQPPTAPVVAAGDQHFYADMDYQQMAMVVDLLRNEKPLKFGWNDANLNQYQLITGEEEPVGDGDGILAKAVPA